MKRCKRDCVCGKCTHRRWKRANPDAYNEWLRAQMAFWTPRYELMRWRMFNPEGYRDWRRVNRKPAGARNVT
jgi:hypothetical protein